MSTYHCQPATQPLDAVVTLPGSKSITNRALVVSALADGTSLIKGMLLAEDTRRMIEALRALGITITVDEQNRVAEVTGCRGQLPADRANLFCGNSGTTIRFCTALTALGHGRFQLDGIERMRRRPIGELADVLRALGAGVECPDREGYPPIIVHARGLGGGHVAFESPQSSQSVSGLMLASPYAMRDVLIDITGTVTSATYLKMTTSVMDHFGVSVIEQYAERNAKLIIAAPQRYAGTTYAVEPDASNATYFLAAPAVAGGRVTVEGLGTGSIQGDVRFVDILERMGCTVTREPMRLTVTGPAEGRRLHGVDVDLNDMPDTAQTLAVLALFADGATTIRNAGNLRVKETDRLDALHRELGKLGARVDESDDGLRIEPPERIPPATIDTYGDHRMAMSFAVAGLGCEGIVINDPQCCGKTFPGFFEQFERMASATA